jgi:hypothetical protein
LWLEINDYNIINRKKIKRFLPPDESERYGKDRAYSLKEIEQIDKSIKVYELGLLLSDVLLAQSIRQQQR